MKSKILFIFSILFFTTTRNFAQGDYRNTLLKYTTSSTGSATPADFETISNNIVITGLVAPLSNSIPGISNPSNAQRIFLTDYITGGFTFNKAYLILGTDNTCLSADFRYTVKEIKHDGTGYVICGNIIKTPATSYFNEAFILKVDNAGLYQWFYRYKVNIAKSTFFNSIEPVKNGNLTTQYVACGYMLDSINIKRAIVMRVDTLGQLVGGVKKLTEGTVSGYQQHSEYKKVISYNGTDFALTGYCSQIPDGCNKHLQSNVLFSMYNVTANSITGISYRSYGLTALDKNVDEGVSLVKLDSGLVVLSQYYNNNNLNCTAMPDIIGNILWINPVTPTNNATWLQLKNLKYNALVNTPSYDYPRDILYDAASGVNHHLWIYNNYNANTGSLLKMNLNTGLNVITPKNMNNNAGYATIDGKTIDFNTSGNVVGLTNYFTFKYSVFEIAASSGTTCLSDSLTVPYVPDTLLDAFVSHDSLDASRKLMDHKAYDIPLAIEYYCDTVFAKPSQSTLTIDQDDTSIEIYPNPTNGSAIMKISVLKNSTANLLIKDISGRTILYQPNNNLVSGNNVIGMNFSNLVTGIYYCAVEINGKEVFIKVVKE